MSEQKPASILAAIHAVMVAVPYVQKTGKNDFHKYSYASEADLLDKIRPAMLEAGLLLIPSIAHTDVQAVHTTKGGAQNYRAIVHMEYTLAHKDGTVWPEKLPWVGCGIDTEDKMIAKAITSGQKYWMLKLFQIETGNDPDQDGGPQGTPKPTQAAKAPTPPAPGSPFAVATKRLQDAEKQGATALHACWTENADAWSALAKPDWRSLCLQVKGAKERLGIKESWSSKPKGSA